MDSTEHNSGLLTTGAPVVPHAVPDWAATAGDGVDDLDALDLDLRVWAAAIEHVVVQEFTRPVTVTVNSNKGGVGKTTSVLMLAYFLARRGYRVLLVDFDPQCNLSTGCGFAMSGADANKYSVNDFMGKYEPGAAAKCIEPVRWTIPQQRGIGKPPSMVPDPVSKLVDLVPGHPDLADRYMEVTKADARFRLDAALEGVRENYHFVLVDTGPGLGFLPECGWAASDYVLGVTQLYYNEVEGVVKVRNKLLADRFSLRRPDLDVVGVVLNEYVDTKTEQQEQLTDLLPVLGEERVWLDAAVPDAEVIRKIISKGWSFSRMPGGPARLKVIQAGERLTDKFLEVCHA